MKLHVQRATFDAETRSSGSGGTHDERVTRVGNGTREAGNSSTSSHSTYPINHYRCWHMIKVSAHTAQLHAHVTVNWPIS